MDNTLDNGTPTGGVGALYEVVVFCAVAVVGDDDIEIRGDAETILARAFWRLALRPWINRAALLCSSRFENLAKSSVLKFLKLFAVLLLWHGKLVWKGLEMVIEAGIAEEAVLTSNRAGVWI